MVKLPDFTALGERDPRPSGSVPSFPANDPRAAALERLGGTLSNVGNSLISQTREQNNAVDLARAESYKTEQFLKTQNDFEQDGDYATYGARAPAATNTIITNAGKLIRDRKMRERWLAGASGDAARVNDSIFDRGNTLRKQAETNAWEDSQEAFRRIYVDPNTSEADKAKARTEIEGSIQAAQGSGLLTPDQADAAKKKFLEDADFSRGKLAIEKDPYLLGGGDNLPAGMRNNNPGNIKYAGQAGTTPSANTDQGDPQAVFPSQAAGMRAAYELALTKYGGGKKTANEIIASDGGWTPGNTAAAANIAKTMGVSPDADLKLTDPANAKKFLRALVTQEHGPASSRYSDAMISAAVDGKSGKSLPIVTKQGAGRISAPNMEGVQPVVLDRFHALQDAFGSSIPVVSGFRDPDRNRRAGGAKFSQHLHGNALDLDVTDMSQADRIKLIQTASAAGFTGIGVYGNSIHIDVGPRRVWGPDHHSGSVPGWAKEAVADHMAGKTAPLATGDTQVASDQPEQPDWYKRLSPEQQSDLGHYADEQQKRHAADYKAAVEIATQNAPVAIQNTGSYSGHIPSADEFSAAYGAVEGAQRYQAFQSAMQVGSQIHDFQTMPSADIQQAVADAQPTSSGDDAALEQKRYEVLSSAADQTLKAREKDPSGYVQQAFPNVAAAWQQAQQNGDYQPALAATAAAEQQIGIQSMALLPSSVASEAADTFKDESKSEPDRLKTVTSLMGATNDPTQRKAIFDQLVKAGLPEISQGAFLAWERGDEGAARRLFQASMVDVSKLPGQSPVKPADVDEAIQTNVMDEGQVGDLYYGLTNGSADNFTNAQRDSKLLSNAVTLRVRAGEDVDAAAAAAAKDLFGDVQAVNDSNVQILVPTGSDPQPTVDGLTSLLPKVRSTLESHMTTDAKGSDKAVLDAVGGNYVDQVMSQGYFRNSGQGYVFIDPFVGAAVADDQGNPIIFSSSDFAKPEQGPAAPPVASVPSGVRDVLSGAGGIGGER